MERTTTTAATSWDQAWAALTDPANGADSGTGLLPIVGIVAALALVVGLIGVAFAAYRFHKTGAA